LLLSAGLCGRFAYSTAGAVAVERWRLLSIDISCLLGRLLLLSIGGTDGRTIG